MSGAGTVGTRGDATDADVAALLAANPQDVGSASDKYEVTDGGFADPEAVEIHDPEPAPATPEPEPEAQHESETQLLGQPDQQAEETEATAPEPDPAEDSGVEPSTDDVYQGLLSAAQAERQARQAIQQKLAEQERLLQEAQSFRQQYEPHIDELSELWPQIQEQTRELETTKRQHAALNKRLELYRAAAQEAGIDVGEEQLLQQERLEMLERQLAELPNQLDTRFARILDHRTSQYAESEQQRQYAEEQARLAAEKQQLVADKLDNFYTSNPALREFDSFIRREVENDPTVDPSVVAAPFLKVLSRNEVAAKAKQRGSVKVQGRQTSQAAPAEQEAASQRNLSDEYAGMGIDAQIAKLRRSGLLG